MLKCAHKDLLTRLAREHTQHLRASLALARAHFNPGHFVIRSLTRRLDEAIEAERAIESEITARQVA